MKFGMKPPPRLLFLNAVLVVLLAATVPAADPPAGTVAPDLLRRAPVSFRNWTFREFELSIAERELLEPDAALLRRYSAPDGQWAELAVVAGRKKRTVHTPGFCLAGGGWEPVRERRQLLAVGKLRIPAARLELVKDGHGMLATYFFTNGAFHTDNLLAFQGVQLLARLRSQPSLGALVRILVPLTGNREQDLALADQFAGAVLPPVLSSLRGASSPKSPVRNGAAARAASVMNVMDMSGSPAAPGGN